MKATGEPQVNTQIYWDHVYTDPDKRDGDWGEHTDRFDHTIGMVKDGEKFCDIGCGIGALTNQIKKAYPNCEVWGTDISKKAIEDNKSQNPDIKYFSQYVGNETKLPDNYFDVVFAGEIIEHLTVPEDLFKDAYRILKSGGRFIVTTPLGDRVKSKEHVWTFEPLDLTNLYTSNGFTSPKFENLKDMEHLYVIYAVGEKI
jgi:ubiquinone/menaquinone biosynthesis C-methylase UbiE